MTGHNYDDFDIDVPGGTLHVGRWNAGAGRVVVAAHGLTGSHLNFEALAAHLGDDYTVIAPDLRGRGRSNKVAGPFGMAAHADDVRAVMDHAGVQRATVVGHSMGGFVAAVMADRHPERVNDLVFVDGGVPLDLPIPTDLPIEEVVRNVVGPALDRLRMTFESVDAYLDYWRPHPALAGDFNDYVVHCYTYDLEGEPPALRPTSNEAAVLEDAGSELRSGDVERALENLRHPVVLVRAERGIFNQVPPLYPEPQPRYRDAFVPDVNHYTILLSDRGAKAVADIIRSAT